MQHTIAASQVQLALVARKLGLTTRWAAMSAHTHSQRCLRRAGTLRIDSPSLAGPMSRGALAQVVDRTCAQGRREVLRTFGCGIRAIEAETLTRSLKA